ncbi:hypothetical protein, partial [Pseudomonas carnis]|uniref:hypothetical protein n=1 Tax=Pseudomonas carnis TaxID=2487355 RepID=UPI001F44D639
IYISAPANTELIELSTIVVVSRHWTPPSMPSNIGSCCGRVCTWTSSDGTPPTRLEHLLDLATGHTQLQRATLARSVKIANEAVLLPGAMALAVGRRRKLSVPQQLDLSVDTDIRNQPSKLANKEAHNPSSTGNP